MSNQNTIQIVNNEAWAALTPTDAGGYACVTDDEGAQKLFNTQEAAEDAIDGIDGAIAKRVTLVPDAEPTPAVSQPNANS